jgi:O-antigen/teichoic acid export membrane protein
LCKALIAGIALSIYLASSLPKEKSVASANIWSALWVQAWPHAIAFAAITFWQRFDQLMVARFLDSHSQGQYAFAARIVSIPILLVGAIAIAIFPDMQRLGRDAPARMHTIVVCYTKIALKYGLLLSFFGAKLVEWIVGYIYPEYKSGLALLPLLSLGIVAYGGQMLAIQSLIGLQKYRASAIIYIVASAAFASLAFVLTSQIGVFGTVVAFNVFLYTLWALSLRYLLEGNALAAILHNFATTSPEEKELQDKILAVVLRRKAKS